METAGGSRGSLQSSGQTCEFLNQQAHNPRCFHSDSSPEQVTMAYMHIIIAFAACLLLHPFLR
jgi:hypothetical protein